MSRKCPRGGLSSCAFLANCWFAIAVAATSVAAPAKAMIAGDRLNETRQSERNEDERVCGKVMCSTSDGLHDASGMRDVAADIERRSHAFVPVSGRQLANWEEPIENCFRTIDHDQ